MDLDGSDRYATAALFTLALHTTQLEVGVDDLGRSLESLNLAWGYASAVG